MPIYLYDRIASNNWQDMNYTAALTHGALPSQHMIDVMDPHRYCSLGNAEQSHRSSVTFSPFPSVAPARGLPERSDGASRLLSATVLMLAICVLPNPSDPRLLRPFSPILKPE